MAGNNYATLTQRIGKYKGEILAHVIPVEVLGRIGIDSKKTIPKNNGDTVIFRRFLPKGATSTNPNTWSVTPETHKLVEGETPNAEQIGIQDIVAQLEQYGVLYRFSDRVVDLFEDDIPAEMKKITGERMGLLMEMIRWGVLKAGTNVYRAGNVASRSLVTGLVSVNILRNVARGLSLNLAVMPTRILSASPNIATEPVEAAYIGVTHTDLEADLRTQLTGFIHVSAYGTRKPIHERELGSWEQYRFITSPHLGPYLSAGATTGANTRLANGVPNSTGAEAVDVYPLLILAEECFGDVMLRGMDGWKVTAIPAGEITKEDPLGQRGFIGAKTYATAVRTNEQWMAVVEVACSALPG